MPRYSICATHFNNAEYLGGSVSVLAELIKGKEQWELVISDAGSTDGSLEQLRDLAAKQDNVRIIVEEDCNIGEGRKVAADHAEGDILIQVTDLDAEYYTDNRIFDIVDFFEKEVDGALRIYGAYIMDRHLLERIGGWRPYPVAEERDLGRRLIRQDELHIADVKLFRKNQGEEKGLLPEYKRALQVSTVKLNTGVSLPHMIRFWLTHADSIKQKIGAIAVFPVGWLISQLEQDQPDVYDSDDPYIFDFLAQARKNNPEKYHGVPEELREYSP